jgi:hypothetical protein
VNRAFANPPSLSNMENTFSQPLAGI